MTEPPYTKQTGQFTIQDDAGIQTTIAIMSRFVDLSWTGSKKREWSEHKKKTYFSADGREGQFVKGTTNKFAFVDEPDRVFTRIG
jgi:hypothetical protein